MSNEGEITETDVREWRVAGPSGLCVEETTDRQRVVLRLEDEDGDRRSFRLTAWEWRALVKIARDERLERGAWGPAVRVAADLAIEPGVPAPVPSCPSCGCVRPGADHACTSGGAHDPKNPYLAKHCPTCRYEAQQAKVPALAPPVSSPIPTDADRLAAAERQPF